MNTASRVPTSDEAHPRPAAAVPPTTRWEHFDHGADIGVRGWGLTKAAAFEQAALAVTAVVTDPSRVAERDKVHIFCEAGDDELLLAAWLNAVITEMSVRRMLFARFQVGLRGRQLSGVATGEHVSPSRHQPAVEVKGATYTALRVARCTDGSWMAQTVVDV